MVVLQLDTDSESSIVPHLTRFSCEHSVEIVSTPRFPGRGDPLGVALAVAGDTVSQLMKGELLLVFVICI